MYVQRCGFCSELMCACLLEDQHTWSAWSALTGWQIRKLVSYVRKLRRRSVQAKHPDINELKQLVRVSHRTKGAQRTYGYPESDPSASDSEEGHDSNEEGCAAGQPLTIQWLLTCAADMLNK